jgi:diaminohydroxyphosphoribosylaminopyrimidine deaminase/5-amino-6-(5-phosphoribosylamino)uracil reductase
MRLALAQARRALGRTFPNPAVGAVVYRGDRVLGRGRTRPPGGAHAEVVALAQARRRHGERALRGAAMAVTLEPCCHVGRTGPCTDAILASGLRRIFVGAVDPHPQVSGRGLRRLRRAGLDVELGVLEAACREQHRGFFSLHERGRPFVMLKLAGSLDGRIATRSGESRWITGPQARDAVHRLRARSDAVVVGSRTALADDPELTARRGGKVVHRPVRVLVDSRLRVPATARLFSGDAERTWVLCARGAPTARRRALERRGVRLIDVPLRGRRLDLRRALRALAGAGLTQVLVEGGGELAAAMLREDLVDEIHWFVSPRLLGGDGRPALGSLGESRLARLPRLAQARVRRVGSDVHWVGAVERGAR